MDPEVVAPAGVAGQLDLGVAEVGEALPVDELCLQYLAGRLVHRVVVEAALGGERPLDAEGLKHEVDLGVVGLAAAVGAGDLDARDREPRGREGRLDEPRAPAAARRVADGLPVAGADERQAWRRGPPTRTQAGSPQACARGACPSKDRSSAFGSSASLGGHGCALKRLLPYALERPFSLMVRDVRLRLATTPRRPGDALAFLEPYPPALRAGGERVGLDGVRRGR